MSRYAIGLDIGITSVGAAVVSLNSNDEPDGIIRLCSRIFEKPEVPKTGETLASVRRQARSIRRVLRRRHHRKERIRELIVSSGLLSQHELDALFDKPKLEDVYLLRARALDERIEREEFVRILIHLSQRRGFKSNRKSDSKSKDGALLGAVKENEQRMSCKQYRTVGEMFARDEAFAETKRNKGGEYKATVSRAMIESEARAVFEAQRKFGAEYLTRELEESYLTILLGQRNFDEGPGKGSPYSYSDSQINDRIGYCRFETGEQRAAKATYSFEYFNLLQSINHLRLVKGGESVSLSDEQRKVLIERAHKKETITYTDVRKTLNIPDDVAFNISYYSGKKNNKGELTAADIEKKKFASMKAYHEMRKAFNAVSSDYFALLTWEQRDAIGDICSKYKTPEKIKENLRGILNAEELGIATQLDFSGFGHLSVKALRKIIPFLEEGEKYNEACEAAGYDFNNSQDSEKQKLLPAIKVDDIRLEITSPVAIRAISQTIKVVNAIIREMGSQPVYINVELARELAKSYKGRKEIEASQKDNQDYNEKIKQQLIENNIDPKPINIVKMKLYNEMGGVSPYTMKPIVFENVFADNTYYQVDHIIPYSKSFNDSFANKVLVESTENQNKGNRLPLEYLPEERKDAFRVWVKANVRNLTKRRNLLKEHLTDEEASEFRDRNLHDTRLASAYLMNYIRDNLQFKDYGSSKKRRHVFAVNGAITAFLRKRWNIQKNRADGDVHHAVDALVIACTSQGLINTVTQYEKYRETKYSPYPEKMAVDPSTGELLEQFPAPWPRFRDELEARLSHDPQKYAEEMKLPKYISGELEAKPVFVSRMVDRHIAGAAHEDTVRSTKGAPEGFSVQKVPLSSLKLKDGEIEGYFNKEDDIKLYNALKERLIAFGGDAKKAFAEPFYRTSKTGERGHEVKKVKIMDKTTGTVKVRGDRGNENALGAAKNDSMLRLDIYYVDGEGYYGVPIYVADTKKKSLPNKAVTLGKPISLWKEMDSNNFCFSLYKNDLIFIDKGKKIKLHKSNKESDLAEERETNEELFYYQGFDISTASISFDSNDGAYFGRGLGIKTLPKLEKWTVDVLGNVSRVKKEELQLFPGMK